MNFILNGIFDATNEFELADFLRSMGEALPVKGSRNWLEVKSACDEVMANNFKRVLH